VSESSTDRIVAEWDCDDENSKAFFMQELYRYYGRTDGTYTGLWAQFKEDLAKRGRKLVWTESCSITELFAGPSKM
jgi:hypothetical protein